MPDSADRTQYLTLKEVGEILSLSTPRLRQILAKKGWPEIKDAWNSDHPDQPIEDHLGPVPARFPVQFLQTVYDRLKDKNATERTPITAALSSLSKKLPESVVTVLESRVASAEQFRHLVCTIVEHSKKLKIWCVSGSLFSKTDPADPLFKAFESRAERIRKGEAEPPQMLFLHPASRAARLRSNAEEGPRKRSYSIEPSDPDNLVSFLRDTRMGDFFISMWNWILRHHDHFELSLEAIRWTRVPPTAWLLWCEEAAILEPYGFGRLARVDYDETTCIGGRAPLLIVRRADRDGVDDYHARLGNGFNWIYEPDEKTAGVVKYLGWDIQRELDAQWKRDAERDNSPRDLPFLGRYPEAPSSGKATTKSSGRRSTASPRHG